LKILRTSLAHPAVIVAFAILVSIVNQAWMYNPFGWVDHWAYLGHIYFFPKLRALFPAEPSGDLLPLILPSALMYKILPPLVANYVVDIFFLVVFLLSIFALVRKFADTTTAWIVLFLAGGYQYLLSAVGSDYTDGRVIPYYAIGLYSISRARDALPTRQPISLALSGAIFACMVYSAILSCVYALVFWLYFVLDFREAQGQLLRQFIKRSASFIAYFSLGILLATAIFFAIYWCYADGFFFKNTIVKLLFFLGGGYSAPPLKEWLAGASWLIFPGAVALASLIYVAVFVIRHHRVHDLCMALEERHVVAIANVVSLSIMLFLNFVIKQWSLQMLYFDQTLPVTFLGLGALLACRKDSAGARLRYAEIAMTAIGSLLVLWLLNRNVVNYSMLLGFITRTLGANPYNAMLILALLTCIVLYPWARRDRIRALRPAAITYLLLFNAFSFSFLYNPFLCMDGFARHNAPNKILGSNASIFRATIDLADFLDAIDPQRSCSLWYNEEGVYGPLFRQVNGMAYLNAPIRRINMRFPKLDFFGGPLGSEGHSPQAGEILLVLSLDPALVHLAEVSLQEKGLAIKEPEVHTRRLGDVVFYATRLSLVESTPDVAPHHRDQVSDSRL